MSGWVSCYGRSQWGQCVLLARRLVEAGVRLVHVNWPRESGDNAVDNPLWDTHAQNADRLEDVLCPQFDVGFTALIEDLGQRSGRFSWDRSPCETFRGNPCWIMCRINFYSDTRHF